jgi:uncharacterized integral membrane protein
MKTIYSLFGFALFVMLLGFALKNSEPVSLQYYLGFVWQAPLSLMLLIAFSIGVIIGIIACLSPLIGQRKRLLALQRELNALAAHAETKSVVAPHF